MKRLSVGKIEIEQFIFPNPIFSRKEEIIVRYDSKEIYRIKGDSALVFNKKSPLINFIDWAESRGMSQFTNQANGRKDSGVSHIHQQRISNKKTRIVKNLLKYLNPAWHIRRIARQEIEKVNRESCLSSQEIAALVQKRMKNLLQEIQQPIF